MSKEKPIEAEAQIIDDGLTPISKAERWLATARETVAEKAAQYKPPETIEDGKQFADAKRARAACRRDAKELDDQRKAMTRQLEDALKEFRTQVKDVLTPLTDLDAEYKRLVDDYEAALKAQRLAELAEAYEDYAPDLGPLVSFDKLLERYGHERGKDWTLLGTNIEAAKEDLYKRVGDIAEAEATIDGLDLPADDAEATKAEYFRTLDLQAALNLARERREQRERVAQLEAERKAREEERRRREQEAEEARLAAEEERRRQRIAELEAAREAAKQQPPAPIETGSVVTPAEFEALKAQTEGTPAPEPTAPVPMPSTPAPASWVFAGYGNEAQKEAFIEFCQRAGIGRHAEVPTNGRDYVLRPKKG